MRRHDHRRSGPVTLPNPVMTASGCAAERPGAAPVLRRRRARRGRHQVGHGRSRAPAAATPRMAETAERHAQLDRPAGPGHRRVRRATTCPGCVERGARAARVDRRQQRRGVRRRRRGGCAASPASTPSSASRSTSPAPTSPTAGWSSPATRLPSAEVVRARARAAARAGTPVFAKLTPDVTDIVAIARAVRRGRRRRADDDQHPARHGHRHRPAAAAARRRHRRAVRAGDPAGRGALRLAGHAAMREGRLPTVPIIGVGGVRTGRDALELVAAGARAVQVGTAIFNDPSRPGPGARRARGRGRPARASTASPTSSASPTRGRPAHEPDHPTRLRRPAARARWTRSGRSASASTRTPRLLEQWGLPDDRRPGSSASR